MAEKKSPAKAKSSTSKSSTKKSSSTKTKDPIKTIQKDIKKDVKKAAKKHPVAVVIIVILVIALIAGALAFLYFNGYLTPKKETFTGLKSSNGKDKVTLNIGDSYNEEGVELYIDDNKIDSTLYVVTTTYYTKGADGEFGTSDDVVVTTIDTTTNNTYLVKYSTTYENQNYVFTKKIFVGVEPLSITLMSLGNKFNGDSIYIKSGDVDILIDAGARKNSGNAIYDYITQPGRCEDGKLEYVIATHAHQDHIAAFVGSKDSPSLLERFEIGTFIQFAKTEAKSELYGDYVTKVDALKNNGTTTVVTALDCWNNTNNGHREYDLGAGTTLKILYNKYYEKDAKGNENLYSVCCLVEHGKNNYLLTGDLEEEGEASLVESNALPEVEFFKANHHGSYTANTDELLSVIKPKCVGISCVAGSDEFTKDDKNQFPSQVAINNIGKYTDIVFVVSQTDSGEDGYKPMNGNITFYSEDGSSYTFTGDNNNTKLKDTDWFKAHRTWPTA